jgi:hypothetical protein
MPSPDDEPRPSRRSFRLNPRGRWAEWTEHRPAGLQRRLWHLALGLALVVGVIMSLDAYIQRRRRLEPEGLRVLQLSPAPESALPLTPFPGAAPDAEVEFRALLMRLPRDRQTPPALLSVHTLSGRLGAVLTDPVGPQGEYRITFTPRRDPDPRRLILAGFRFEAAAAGAPAPGAGGAPAGPDLVLDLEVPRRVDPPMEPEGEGALVLQITGRLRPRQGGR